MRRAEMLLWLACAAISASGAIGAGAPDGARVALGDSDEDLALLLAGVVEVAAPGVPGPLVVFGENAFPVVCGKAHGDLRAAVVAAARFGAGRVVAFGHTGYGDPGSLDAADTGRLMRNAIAWAANRTRDEKHPRDDDRPLRIAARDAGWAKWLTEHNIEATALTGADWSTRLADFDVFCCTQAAMSDDDVAAVQRFIKSGGGFLITGLGWGWLQLNAGKDLSQHPGNRILAPAGIVWTDGTLEKTGKIGFLTDPRPPADGTVVCPRRALFLSSTAREAAFSIGRARSRFQFREGSLRDESRIGHVTFSSKAPCISRKGGGYHFDSVNSVFRKEFPMKRLILSAYVLTAFAFGFAAPAIAALIVDGAPLALVPDSRPGLLICAGCTPNSSKVLATCNQCGGAAKEVGTNCDICCESATSCSLKPAP